MVTILLERECDLHMNGSNGWTALHWTVEERRIDSMKMVLKRGISIDEPGADSLNSLCIAAINGYTDVMRILIEEGASIRHVDKRGRSALFHACQNGQKAAVHILLCGDAGIDLAKEKRSPLIIASRNGHKDVVDEIVEAISNNRYEYRVIELLSAYRIAHRNEHEDVANLLVRCLESDSKKDIRRDMCYNSGSHFRNWDFLPGEVFVETIHEEGDKLQEKDCGAALKPICL